jgi:flagellar basal-body rod protein FlgB
VLDDFFIGPVGKSRASDGEVGMADLFGLAEQRLAYIDQRQRVVAQNIANADTPDYQPRDLMSFDKLLRSQPVVPSVTNPLHLTGPVQNASLVRDVPVERAVDGNAVSVEGQLTKIADDETNASLVGNLWKTYMGMYMTALGKSG